MKLALAAGLLLLTIQQTAKNDPNGVWESESGTQYRLSLTGEELHVRLVEGSNPRYLKYEVDLKNLGDPNMYQGKGYLVGKKIGRASCRERV